MPGYPCCRQTIECESCEPGTAPAQYQLDVPGGTFFSALVDYCDTCDDDFCGTFLLDRDLATPPIFEGACVWTSAVFEACVHHSRDDEHVPEAPPDLAEFYWHLEVSEAGPGLFLIQQESGSFMLRFQWSSDPELVWSGDCAVVEWPLVYNTTHESFPGCAFDPLQILTMTSL